MKVRILSLLFVAAALCTAQSPKKKKTQTPAEPSPLDKYISDASKDGSSPQAVRPPGSTGPDNALFSTLGLDLSASRVDDLVTIVVSETFSAVANGDVKTPRQATAQSNISQLAGITKTTGPLANLLNTNTHTQLQGTGDNSRGDGLNDH